MLHDAGVSLRVGDELAPPRGRHATNHPLAHRKGLGLQHLLNKLGPRAQLHALRIGNGPVRGEQPLDRHAAHHVVRVFFKDAGAECAGAEDGGVHNPLE